MTEPPEQAAPDAYVAQLYQPSTDGTLILYAGGLTLWQGDKTWLAQGNLELRLGGRPEFFAHLAGREAWLSDSVEAERFSVELPSVLSLDPPTSSALPVPDGDSSWMDREIRIDRMLVGTLTGVRSVVLHIVGKLTDYPLPDHATDFGPQGQIHFSLPGWKLQLARANPEPSHDADFTYVIRAVSPNGPVSEDDVAVMVRRVLILLRLVASGGIGIGPRVGLDDSGQVVWADWWTPHAEPAGQRWCPDSQVVAALPVLADGLSALDGDRGLEACVDRAVSLLLAINEPGLLDVKIPIVCSGLELLGWSILQHRQWLMPDDLDRLSAGARTRLLLQWAGIPIDLPSDFTALHGWRGRGGRSHTAGPELIFEIRNRVVHPPKRLSDPEWPNADELWEAFKLATSYLELALMRILDYHGRYSSRLDSKGWAGRTEHVPWRRLDSGC
jgi:hypothetical protein